MPRSSTAVVVAVCSAVLLQACSGGGDPRRDPPAVVLTSSSPTHGALGVARSSQVTLTFSGALDAATVGAATVSLRCVATYAGEPYYDLAEALTSPAVVPVAVSYEATSRTLTVAPHTPLATRRSCVVATDGVRDADGRAVAASVSFRTAANPVTRRAAYDAKGVMFMWHAFEHDGAGNLTRSVSHRGAGADGEWFTADDEESSARMSTYDGAGNWTSSLTSSDPGEDLAWFTADDPPPSELGLAVFDDAGRPARLAFFAGAGPDELPFTSDDVPSQWSRILHSPDGDVVAETFHHSPGIDATWFTTDDPVSAYDAFSYDAPGGRLLRLTTASSAGPDLKWLTPDDVPDYYYSYEYDAAGVHAATVSFGGPGADGVWFTDDDAVQGCQRVWYDDERRPTRFAWYWPGPDGRCFTSDDGFQSRRDLAYAENGSLLEETSYFRAGPDGLPFTDDDIPNAKTWFDASL